MRAAILATAALLALAACGKKEAGGGAVSSGEARALNDAAEMLDQDSVDANAVANVAEQGNAE